MRTALPIPAFARGRSKPPRRQLPYRFTIDRCRDKLALSELQRLGVVRG